MGKAIIISPVKDLNLLCINPLPGRPLKNAQVVRSPWGLSLVAIDARGNIYSSQVTGTRRQYSDLDTRRIGPTMDALVKLKAISREALENHRALAAAEFTKDAKRSAAAEVIGDMKKIGLTPTKAQLIKIESALGGGARARAIIADALGVKALPA